MATPKLRADFNGLFCDVLCLSHGESCIDEDGNTIQLTAGMAAIAFDEDADENGQRDDLIAFGIVEQSPPWLTCTGSKWLLRIDSSGVRHEELTDEAPQIARRGNA